MIVGCDFCDRIDTVPLKCAGTRTPKGISSSPEKEETRPTRVRSVGICTGCARCVHFKCVRYQFPEVGAYGAWRASRVYRDPLSPEQTPGQTIAIVVWSGLSVRILGMRHKVWDRRGCHALTSWSLQSWWDVRSAPKDVEITHRSDAGTKRAECNWPFDLTLPAPDSSVEDEECSRSRGVSPDCGRSILGALTGADSDCVQVHGALPSNCRSLHVRRVWLV
jgi:hypothetical protein